MSISPHPDPTPERRGEKALLPLIAAFRMLYLRRQVSRRTMKKAPEYSAPVNQYSKTDSIF